MLLPESGGGRLGAGLIDVEDGNPRAVFGEEPGRGEPDAAFAGRARDHGCLVDKKHTILPSFIGRDDLERLLHRQVRKTDPSVSLVHL
jgi:hypothetical protein